jgi:hypothetical protein
MAWIKTIPLAEANEKLLRLRDAQQALYPIEYAEPVPMPGQPQAGELPSIVATHTLIPEALYHAFSTFGVLLAPELPLSRREHELITTVVSVTNRCFY